MVVLIAITISDYKNEAFIDVIKQYEGFSATPYICPAGYLTIGYGHLWKGSKDTQITEEEATRLFLEDFQKAVDCVEAKAGEALKDEPMHRALALASFVFNLGAGNFKQSTLLRKVKAKDWEGAAAEFERWTKAYNPKTKKKETLGGLVKRRKTEAHYFLTGEVKVF